MEIDLLSPLIQTGPIGVVLLWFMYRLEKIINHNSKRLETFTLVLVQVLQEMNPEKAAELGKQISREQEGS